METPAFIKVLAETFGASERFSVCVVRVRSDRNEDPAKARSSEPLQGRVRTAGLFPRLMCMGRSRGKPWTLLKNHLCESTSVINTIHRASWSNQNTGSSNHVTSFESYIVEQTGIICNTAKKHPEFLSRLMLQEKIHHHKNWISSEQPCPSKLFGFASTNRSKSLRDGYTSTWHKPLNNRFISMPNKNMHMLQIKPVKAHAISPWSTNSVRRSHEEDTQENGVLHPSSWTNNLSCNDWEDGKRHFAEWISPLHGRCASPSHGPHSLNAPCCQVCLSHPPITY